MATNISDKDFSKILKTFNLDVNNENCTNENILNTLCKTTGVSFNKVKMLIDKGINVTNFNEDGNCPLMHLIKNQNIEDIYKNNNNIIHKITNKIKNSINKETGKKAYEPEINLEKEKIFKLLLEHTPPEDLRKKI